MKLTEEEAKEFFEEVEGKKIRWTDWSEVDYFIPESYDPDALYGHAMTGTEYPGGGKALFYISYGFNKNHIRHNWEFYESADKISKLAKEYRATPGLTTPTDSSATATTTTTTTLNCSCSLDVIMRTGCECGGA